MTRPVPFLDLKRFFFGLRISLAVSTLKAIWEANFILGPQVVKFEQEFARYLGVRGTLGVGNGTDGLEIVLEALNLPRESHIMVPANSFIATAEAVVRTGHKVVFVDVRDDGVIDHGDVRRKLSPKTAVLVHVHMYGNPSGIPESVALCDEAGITLIEDCAQAHGAWVGGRHVGTFGKAGIFSFYPGKVLGGFGDGGAIVYNEGLFGETCRRISNHGRLEKFDHLTVGRNSRLDTIQAAVLSAKLPWLERDVRQRNSVANWYRALLTDLEEVKLPPSIASGTIHSYHLFVAEFLHRDELAAFLRKRGIQTGVHYPEALPDLPPFRGLGSGAYSVSRRRAKAMLSLPMGPHLTKAQVRHVCDLISVFYRSQKSKR